MKGDKLMDKLNQIINITKRLIDLPYNKFNLENYLEVLFKNKLNPSILFTEENLPIKLMSSNHDQSGIIDINYDEKRKRNIYIIGKGILFDSGGLNLKTGRGGPYGMHGDKAGMIIALSVANYLKDNVVGYCPVTTNFIQNSKITPGDILKIGNKRVVVNNTDAEGRLILAEAISTLNASKDDIIITVATLTGACEYAIDKATGVLSPSDKLAELFLTASKEEKEYAWRLPMFDYMDKMYKKQPFKNAEDKIKAGTSEGAMFLKQFVPYPENWIHLDIAASSSKDGKATGIPIKSLINFIRRIK
jgi:leucyl aminopeptidase